MIIIAISTSKVMIPPIIMVILSIDGIDDCGFDVVLGVVVLLRVVDISLVVVSTVVVNP